jgi:osmoprotectant transport system permease protein
MAYLLQHPREVGELLLAHLQLIASALPVAVALALPLAWVIERHRWLQLPVLGALGMLYTVPSLALAVLLVPLLGLSARTAVAAMVLYAQAILVRQTATALASLDPGVREAARGMGMTAWQRWWRVEFPLILSPFLAGVRLAATVTLAIAAIGAKFGAGGLGTLLFDGVQQNQPAQIWAGAIALAGLALALNGALLALERQLKAGAPRI